MAFKVLIFAATLAFVRAGLIATAPEAVSYSSAPAVSSSYFHQASAPAAIAHAAPVAYAAKAPVAVAHSTPVVAHAVHAPSVGYSQQNVARSLGGAQSVSTYSKAEDSAFSSVRKYDTRITNDAISYGAAPLISKSYAAPIAAYAHAAPVAYAQQPLLARSYAAPSPLAYSAPVVHNTYAAPAPLAYSAPVVQKAYAAAAPVAYSAPVLHKTYGAAPVAYAQPAPVAYAQPAHLIAKQVAPFATYGAAAPVVAKHAVSYSPAAVVAHTNFEGYGVEYHY